MGHSDDERDKTVELHVDCLESSATVEVEILFIF